MPWCEDCGKFWNPNSMGTGGECPTCHRVIASPKDVQDATNVPWHFKLLLVALVLYLGFRAYQGIFWVVQHV